MNVTVSLGFSLRFTTRIHFTFSSTARIGHSLRPSSSIRVLRAVSEEGGGNPTRVKGDRRAEKQIRKKTTGNSRVTKETERIQSLGRSLPISALHLTSSGPFLISLRPAGAPLRGTRWKGYEVSVGNRDSEVNGESRTVPFSRHSLAPSGSTSRGSFMTGGHESNEGTTDMTREPAR